MTTLALTDRGTGAGTVRFANAAAGICPVFGGDVTVAPLASPGPAAGRLRTPVHAGAQVTEPPLRITLPAQNLAGGTAGPPGVRRARRGLRRAAGRVSSCTP
ncbi:hypothetical protein [Streptomyces sp. Ag109_O5-1]|uniref:hypothetical protein n=1 Tax=Streptomyces sp. Ag109_O5-1 TaxID=1938851 RepID=UPI00162A25FA|nr:hypothetical protein [Streptomyces sp. Ag109_O5-1]